MLTAETGLAALDIIAKTELAVLLADQQVRGMSGVELCARARAVRPTLVTLLTIRFSDLAPIVEGMKLGHVTAYLPKPCAAEQILDALVLATGCRPAALGGGQRPDRFFVQQNLSAVTGEWPRPDASSLRPAVLEWGPFRVDLPAQRVWISGNELLNLEPLQIRVLGCLIERAGTIWPREQLCARLYRQGAVNSRAISRAIWALRHRCAEARRLIVSVRGVGYGLGVTSSE